jgi:hypothetical protein
MNVDNGAAAYDVWAPAEARWSPWVKPVLFEALNWSLRPLDKLRRFEPDSSWAPTPVDQWAMVLDMPGVDALSLGMSVARRGWRPVPLFNGVPDSAFRSTLIDVLPLLAGLDSFSAELAQLPLRPDSPPVFILDSRRKGREPGPGDFDNRWFVTPQDFPSANRLRHHGIMRVLVVTEVPPAPDLAAVLKRWEEGGLISLHQNGATRTPLQIPRPPHFRSLLERALVLSGLRRSSAGGFGGITPDPGEGGSGHMRFG